MSVLKGRFDSKKLALVVSIAVIGGLSMMMLVSGCGDSSVGSQGSSAIAAINTITVAGKATVSSAPDEAVLTLSVESDGADPGASMNANSVAVTKVLERLAAEGVDSASIETANVTVTAIRTYNPETGAETLTGYRSQNTVTVTLADAQMVGKVLAAAVETGATNVSGPVWKLKDDSATVVEALKQAVANARTKAEALAEAQGVKIGDVIMMNEGSIEQPVVPIYTGYYDTAGAGESTKLSPTPISEATLDVTATVTVTYVLKH